MYFCCRKLLDDKSPRVRRKHRSSRPEVFCRKVVPRNFAKFTGKHLCESQFFNKIAGEISPESLFQ